MMRVRRAVTIFGSVLLFLSFLMVYLTMDMTLFPNQRDSIKEEYKDVSKPQLIIFLSRKLYSEELGYIVNTYYLSLWHRLVNIFYSHTFLKLLLFLYQYKC